MGLLDQFNNLSPEQSQGLLAAAAQMLQQSGPSLRPTSFGQILGGGLSAYQGGLDAATRRKLEEDQAKQTSQLNSLKLQEAQAGMQDHATSRAENERLRQFYLNRQLPTGQPQLGGDQQQQPQQALPQALGATPQQSTPGMSGMLPQAPQQAAQGQPSPYEQRMAEVQALKDAGFHTQAAAAEQAALKFKPEFDQTPRTGVDRNGKPIVYVMDKDGNKKIISGVLPRDEMKLMDNGSGFQAYNPFALTPGQTFKKGMTPGEIASNSLGRDRLAFDKEQQSSSGNFTPEAIANAAARYNIDGTLPPMGMGKAGSTGRSAILNKAAELASQSGLSSDDQRIQQIGNKANSAALSKIQQSQTMVGAFEKNFNRNADIALEFSQKVDRTGVPIVNKWINAGKRSVAGDPDLSAFDASVKAVSNEYAKIISGSMGNTAVAEGEIKKISDLLNAAQTPEQMKSVIQLMQRETQNRMKGFDEEKAALRNTMKSGAKPSSDDGFSVVAPNGKKYTFPDAKSLANFKLSAGI